MCQQALAAESGIQVSEQEQTETPGRTIWCTSIFGAKTHRGLVQITEQKSELNIIITPDEARNIARDLIQVASAAEHDAFLVDFLSEKTGTKWDQAVQIMREFREWRKQQP